MTERCHASADREWHVPGCRPARPLCRWRRRVQIVRRPCRCDFVHYPHRAGWCAVQNRENVPLVIRKSRSWQRQERQHV